MRMPAIIVILITSSLAGCVSGEKKASELLDTAVFEEKQNNFEHAVRLYDEILKKYPDTRAAQGASARMSALRSKKT